jgi:hypothetical protein
MSKVFQIVAIVFIVLSCCALALKFSDFLKDYSNLNSELKPIGSSLALLGIGFLAVAKRMKSKEAKTG